MAQSHMGTPRSTLPGGHPTVVTEEIAAAAKRQAALVSRKLWGNNLMKANIVMEAPQQSYLILKEIRLTRKVTK